MRADRLRIGVIGAGKVGPILALALAGVGHEIVAINAVGEDKKERLDALLPGVAIKAAAEVVALAELLIIAVPDSELENLIKGLTETDSWQPGQIVLHTSAKHGFGVLTPAMTKGVIPVAFHPAIVFTGTSLDLARMQEATVAVTAPTPVLPIAQALAVEIGAEPVIVAEANRAEYADALEALSEITESVAAQTIAKLNDLGLTHPKRTVATLARAAIDQAIGGVAEANELWFGNDPLA